ncbi:MAG: mannose-phosphate guanylyltransferase, partial [Candidatus Poribacteria bacterium]|nr:mannose-phosphate guanylyltransferase [Candidatus Poribacteria bacterium]
MSQTRFLCLVSIFDVDSMYSPTYNVSCVVHLFVKFVIKNYGGVIRIDMHLPYAIILSGGQGTRLWPLTANGIPKAFLSFDSTGISLLKNTILRLSNLLPYERIIIVAGQSHKKELHIHSKDIPDENVILEPVGRGTLPCIGLTALYVKRKD